MYGVEICSNCPARKGKYANNEPAFIRPRYSHLQRRLMPNLFKIVENSIQVEAVDEDEKPVARFIMPKQASGTGEIKSSLSSCKDPVSLLGMKLCGAVLTLNEKYEDKTKGEK